MVYNINLNLLILNINFLNSHDVIVPNAFYKSIKGKEILAQTENGINSKCINFLYGKMLQGRATRGGQ